MCFDPCFKLRSTRVLLYTVFPPVLSRSFKPTIGPPRQLGSARTAFTRSGNLLRATAANVSTSRCVHPHLCPRTLRHPKLLCAMTASLDRGAAGPRKCDLAARAACPANGFGPNGYGSVFFRCSVVVAVHGGGGDGVGDDGGLAVTVAVAVAVAVAMVVVSIVIVVVVVVVVVGIVCQWR